MKIQGKDKVKIAVIDMNKGAANQGMQGIQEILLRYKREKCEAVNFDLFDLRGKGELPGLDYDIFISSGGPGNPYDGEGKQWEADFFALLDNVEAHNKRNEEKKHVFLICHSFQLACRKYGLGQVIQRKSNAFGIFPVHLTREGQQDVVFEGMQDILYAVDSRDWQVVQPDPSNFSAKGALILALEKERPHVPLERCIMSVRFTPEIVGTQFHPEADPIGMKKLLIQEDKKSAIIKEHGETKYLDMLNSLEDPKRIMWTQHVVLPNFLDAALHHLQEA